MRFGGDDAVPMEMMRFRWRRCGSDGDDAVPMEKSAWPERGIGKCGAMLTNGRAVAGTPRVRNHVVVLIFSGGYLG